MKLRDIVIAVVILGIVGFVLYNISTGDKTPKLDPQETLTETEMQLEERFGRDIPDDLERVELKRPSTEGEDTVGQVSAIATRDVEDGKYSATILADLEDPAAGTSYFAWINKDDEYVLLGKMQQAKGGWLIDYQAGDDYSDYNKVVVSQQSSANAQPEDIVLEGSF